MFRCRPLQQHDDLFCLAASPSQPPCAFEEAAIIYSRHIMLQGKPPTPPTCGRKLCNRGDSLAARLKKRAAKARRLQLRTLGHEAK